MRAEVVERQLDCLAGFQPAYVVNEQIVVERIRMVEIGEAAKIEWKVRQVAIVGVLLNENDFTGTNRFKNAIGDRRLSRSRAATNADYHTHNLNPEEVSRKGAKTQRKSRSEERRVGKECRSRWSRCH